MKKMKMFAMAVPVWASLWLVLAGADRGCHIVETDCGSLDEQACAADDSCQAVYGYDDGIYMEDGENLPSCAPGTRCMEPQQVFLECMDADADPCEGLDEQACWQRPICEAEYIQNRQDFMEGTQCIDEEPEYVACHLRQDECQSADDCYNLVDYLPGCKGFYFTCDNGQCVEHCDENECRSDDDCAQGEYCAFDDYRGPEEWCGVGHCEPANTGCRSDDECGFGERCEIYCGNGWCKGQCVADQQYCQTDEDCAEGSFCEAMFCDGPEECPSLCTPGVWTFTEPVQCGGNLWEMDEARNPERYTECYVDCEDGMDCGSSAWEEICKVRVYFLFSGIVLHDLRDVWLGGDTCAACDCPRGDVIYALVAPYQLDAILGYGFQTYTQN